MTQTPGITPAHFVEKWERAQLKERSSYQEHFNDVCRLVGHLTPAEKDPTGEVMTFEYGVKKLGGSQGYADAFYRGHFAIEYKGKGKYTSLDDAYRQLQQYRENLLNPPLLIVCDIENWEIHTNWPNTEKKVYTFKNADILRPHYQRILHNLFFEPNALHPARTAEQVTGDAAGVFKQIAENMRAWEAAPERIARFLTKIVFCLFAEDVGLLPTTDSGKGIFTEIVEKSRQKPTRLTRYLRELFENMRDGGEMQYVDIPYFDGRLFDNVDVEDLSLEALTALEDACHLDWSSIEPAIFGTLFERSLDPGKRAQLGAHYTSRDDILLIVEPVLMQPLRREWERVKAESVPITEAYTEAIQEKNRRKQQNRLKELEALREGLLEKLRTVAVLDPACGSGNFLYVSLGLLLDLEKEVINFPGWADLPRPFPEVHPRQLHGIEISPIAHDLASIVAWIGYIQWKQNNGYLTHNEPILEPLDNIEQKDAILGIAEDGTLYDPEWPSVDVIVSNPPFLGGNKIRQELGDQYVERLFTNYDDRVPAFADLVCYWFERAREQIEQGCIRRAGLLATNSIRGGANREVLKRIKESGDIFMAWSDREWILDGAAVRVSMVGFDTGTEQEKLLDGYVVNLINPDLTASVDITTAKNLEENARLCFMGPSPKGPFDIDETLAKKMLEVDPHEQGIEYTDVIRPVVSGVDIVKRSRNKWTIDFGLMSLDQAAKYVLPFKHVQEYVYPIRSQNRRAAYAEKWWQYAEARPGMRSAIGNLHRFIATPTLAKHRVYVWYSPEFLCNQQTLIFPRSDNYFFGVLHSRLHEVWALRMGTSLEDRPRYTPTTTFETFPFPWTPGQEDTTHPAHAAISAAAKQLNEEREAWLNPSGLTNENALKKRTLTNLYNALLVFRGVPAPEGKKHPKIAPAAGEFAPRLDELHHALDVAVCDAYGWPHDILEDEEEILRRLLALNLERAG